MWKVLGRLFGSEKVIDAGLSGIDKIVYTNEEKADYQLKFLKAYEPFKVAQRFLAVMFSGVYLFILLIAALSMLAGAIIEMEDLYKVAAKLIGLINDNLGWVIITIVAFYFAGGTVNSFRQMNKRSRKEKQNNK